MSVSHRNKELQIIGDYDVVVCGGGPAGIMAAISAARNGASTALIERYGFLGGTATAGGVTPISEFKKGGRPIIGGLPWEFVLEMRDLGGARTDYPNGYIPFDPEIYKLVAQRMVAKAGVSLYLHSIVSDLFQTQDRITHVVVESKSGPMAIGGRCFIDCTGDADLAYMAGAPMQPSFKEKETLQPMTLWFQLGGVDTAHLEGLHLDKEYTRNYNVRVHELFSSSTFPEEMPLFGGPWFITSLREGIINVNMSRIMASAVDPAELTAAECRLREDVSRLAYLLKQYIPEFSESFLLSTGIQAGARETRHIKGIHTVTLEEIRERTLYPDRICKGAHNIDVHKSDSPEQELHYLEEAYSIPYRCMVMEDFPNLAVAGRCVSAEKEAFASMRVQAPCMAEGQAAGCAAALCTREGIAIQEIDIGKLQDTLRLQGAIF